MPLNKGKIQLGQAGTLAATSYGPTSPADDAIPLAWQVGDTRYYQSSAGLGSFGRIGIKWVCIAAGTPGTWQLVRTPIDLPVNQSTNVYKGGWNFGGDNEIFMAPATADWAPSDEGNPNPLMVPIAASADLESTGAGPCVIAGDIWLSKNEWDVNTANGLTFRIRLHDGTVMATGQVNANAAFTGHFHIGAVIPAGVLDNNMGLRSSLEVAAAAGTGSVDICFVMSLFRNFNIDFPS